MGESKKVLIDRIIKEIEQFDIDELSKLWMKIVEIKKDGR
jgi:hypothetical protein